MKPSDLLRIVDSMHRDKNIEKEVVFRAIEAALVTAARKHYGEEAAIVFQIDRDKGEITGSCDGLALVYEEVIGRIGAQTAKQVIIQKLREAERDALIEEFQSQMNELVSGVVQRNEGGVTTVALGPVEAILPRSEQIPKEAYHPNQRIEAIVTDVRAQGSRVKVVLSRTRPKLVQRLFEQEIPEIAEGIIKINAVSREPGHRSKVAVSSDDQQVDCVGACVGVRGSRIRTIKDELGGEQIDIVRWSSDPQTLITNALKPADVEEVILCQMLGRAIVLVKEDHLSLAIGKRGQNVRLASKLVGWDIEIMTQEELEKQIEKAVAGFCKIEGITEELANQLVGEGYLTYDDLSVIEPDDLMSMGELTEDQVDNIVTTAEEMAEAAAQAGTEGRGRKQAGASSAGDQDASSDES
ncbi:MAG: transcription termination factor NusA [Planctomycetaceae bacterium]|nr:transcription termination factor NusA [Planctomycetaceae bacterium]